MSAEELARAHDGEFLSRCSPRRRDGQPVMRVTMLGCGPSWGVPRIGGDWGACDPGQSEEPPPPRRRCWSRTGGARLLVDTSPDLREQLLGADVRGIDAVLFTHAHADHLHGIDDLRSVNR